ERLPRRKVGSCRGRPWCCRRACCRCGQGSKQEGVEGKAGGEALVHSATSLDKAGCSDSLFNIHRQCTTNRVRRISPAAAARPLPPASVEIQKSFSLRLVSRSRERG